MRSFVSYELGVRRRAPVRIEEAIAIARPPETAWLWSSTPATTLGRDKR
jgi:hypothetical protein